MLIAGKAGSGRTRAAEQTSAAFVRALLHEYQQSDMRGLGVCELQNKHQKLLSAPTYIVSSIR